MRLRHYLVVSLLFVIVGARPAAAAPSHEYGFGTNSCGDYLAARKAGNAGLGSLYTAWFTGYITDESEWTTTIEHATVDELAGTDLNGALYWMEKFCREHPTADFAVAAAAFTTWHIHHDPEAGTSEK